MNVICHLFDNVKDLDNVDCAEGDPNDRHGSLRHMREKNRTTQILEHGLYSLQGYPHNFFQEKLECSMTCTDSDPVRKHYANHVKSCQLIFLVLNFQNEDASTGLDSLPMSWSRWIEIPNWAALWPYFVDMDFQVCRVLL